MQALLDGQTVLRRLKELRWRDPGRRVFGSTVHDYRLAPPLSVAAIESFERQHRVTLPADYRHFTTAIGNGGAGPFYGLLPFGQDDDDQPWETHRLVGDLSQPFPHRTAWNLPEEFWRGEPRIPVDILREEEDRLLDAWDHVEQQHYWNPAIMNGAIPICHIGCALRQWLVINGEQKGFLWNDDRADRGGISPLRDASQNQVTFADWYVSWLDESLRQVTARGVTGVANSIRCAFARAADAIHDQFARCFARRESP